MDKKFDRVGIAQYLDIIEKLKMSQLSYWTQNMPQKTRVTLSLKHISIAARDKICSFKERSKCNQTRINILATMELEHSPSGV